MNEPPQNLQLNLRNLKRRDINKLQCLMDKVYPDIGGSWSSEFIQQLITQFPEGQIILEDHNRLVAAVLTLRCSYDRFIKAHTYSDLLEKNIGAQHNPHGDALYGLDVFVDPDYRGMRLGRRLYDARKELCGNLNLRAILAGGRIVNYHKYSDKLTPAQYIESVRQKAIYDPILSFQLANQFEVKRILKDYNPEDRRSGGFATLLEWNNILHEPEGIAVEDIRKVVVRVGIVQWQMRIAESFKNWLNQVEYFVDSMSDYQCDFVLFPEFFNAPLMGLCEEKSQYAAIRFLATYADQIISELSGFAVSYNINIIAGSLPVLIDDKLYNHAYLCHRDGSVDSQPKIHITPHERRDWVIQGGNKLNILASDVGNIGILVCYDIEFPELARILAHSEMDILFVPFWTDTKNGFLRVQRCAQARAIENECYVVIGGSVGNLPQVDNLDIQYAQSAVYSPSDFAFPHDATMAESTPNTEMALIADLDISKLDLLRHEGSVTNSKDRRGDLYELRWIYED